MKKATRMMLMNDEFDKSRNETKPMGRAGITDRNYDPGEPDWGGGRGGMRNAWGGERGGMAEERDGWADERGGRMPMANRRARDRMRGAMGGRRGEEYERGRKRRGMWDDDEEDEDDDDYEEPVKKERDWTKSRIYASGTVMAEPGMMPKKADEEQAYMWVGKMRNADGSMGPHYEPEKAEQLRKAHYPEGDKWEWFVAINMMYSDYMPVAKKMGMDKDDFYCSMAKAFLDDPDAGPEKLEKYMMHIPKK